MPAGHTIPTPPAILLGPETVQALPQSHRHLFQADRWLVFIRPPEMDPDDEDQDNVPAPLTGIRLKQAADFDIVLAHGETEHLRAAPGDLLVTDPLRPYIIAFDDTRGFGYAMAEPDTAVDPRRILLSEPSAFQTLRALGRCQIQPDLRKAVADDIALGATIAFARAASRFESFAALTPELAEQAAFDMQRSMADRHLLDLLTNTEGERDRIDDIEAGQLAEELIAGTHRGILAGRRLAQQLAADGHDRMRIPFSDLLRRANGFAHEPIRLIGRKIMAQIAKEFPLEDLYAMAEPKRLRGANVMLQQSLALQLTLGGRLGEPVFNPPAATQAVYPEETDLARAAKSLIGRLPRSPEFPDEIRVKFRQMPGYEAKVNLLLDGPFFVLAVEDAFGDYLYTWPHPDFQPQALANVADGAPAAPNVEPAGDEPIQHLPLPEDPATGIAL